MHCFGVYIAHTHETPNESFPYDPWTWKIALCHVENLHCGGNMFTQFITWNCGTILQSHFVGQMPNSNISLCPFMGIAKIYWFSGLIYSCLYCCKILIYFCCNSGIEIETGRDLFPPFSTRLYLFIRIFSPDRAYWKFAAWMIACNFQILNISS